MKLIYANSTNAAAVALGEYVAGYLSDHGETVAVAGDNAACGDIDMIMVIGGDGTILRALREYPHTAPVWSVNAGHLGYLTECDPDGLNVSLNAVLAGAYRLERRTVLAGKLTGSSEHDFFAINEAVMHRGGCMRGMHIKLRVDGTDVFEFSGDGILVSTPTGSTAYNMSAGGPILLPQANDLAITPVCSHSALRASVVVPGDSVVSVQLSPDYRLDGDALPELVVDGLQRFAVQPGDSVECSAAPWQVEFVRVTQDSFYDRLQRRLVRGLN